MTTCSSITGAYRSSRGSASPGRWPRFTPTTLTGIRSRNWFSAAAQIRRAVTTTLQQLGVRDCAARVAGEFGDHPDTAVARMSWALATINTVYPVPSMTSAPGLRSLAFAS